MIIRHLDSDPLVTGTHKGADSASSLYEPSLDFKMCSVATGLAIYNETQTTNGNVSSVTANNVESDITWDNGDTYSIYKTATKDSSISTIAVDKSRGWKVVDLNLLNKYGFLPKDADSDRDENGTLIVKEIPPPKLSEKEINAMIIRHTDSDPLITGTHKGTSGVTTLSDPGGLFKTCGIKTGLAIYKTGTSGYSYMTDQDGNIMLDQDGNPMETNTTDANENGLVVTVTEKDVTTSGITYWKNGDTYSIYKTGTKDANISTIMVDKSRGWKVKEEDEFNEYGWRAEDEDLDKDEYGNSIPKHEQPFGPKQPYMEY
ncbi:hypothetical protein [Pseudoalteromonas sp.]|uniref:hypothetical protein n=1 Tax=Pseudoalteromonas sp. TaxID=53249 RepID=UPI0026069DAF|nr:hypothetical protein [Pseudoalteromonas sp.]MCP4585326.1 hypothetical protein [Pseudoalteromonas sp.]